MTTRIAPCATNLAPPAAHLDVAAIDRDRILQKANQALETAPITITAFRTKLSEGGPNDFYSNGDYWWPDASKPDGLPYIKRDGESNPENFVAHRICMMQLRDSVASLAAAYKLTSQDRYTARAAKLLRVFFLDSGTRMNPSLQFAQAIPGVSPGRGIGIIDTLHLVEVPLAAKELEKSAAFPEDVRAGLKAWFREYLAWMNTSKNGKDEAAAHNNHSVAYDLQRAVFATYVGDLQTLTDCRRRFKEVFVPQQMALDGSFPAELARTKPYGYSIFQLDNLASLCRLLSAKSENLWAFTLPDGRGMRRAMDFLYPYLADKSKWPHAPDVQAWAAWPARGGCLLFAGLAFQDQKYLDLWKTLPADPTDAEVRRNIAITQPLLWLEDAPPEMPAPGGKSTPASGAGNSPEIRTPPGPASPRINGASVFGVRPNSPFLFHIPATGDRPMRYFASHLPAGLELDEHTGDISGAIQKAGQYVLTLGARNSKGTARNTLHVIAGETIALTPPMGWNSWNCWGGKVDAEKVLAAASAMVESGLINHGWSYIVIDDSWQGQREGPFHALQGNRKFPEMAELCQAVHRLGLKIGIYSTPWTTSYAGYPGGSSENAEGSWTKPVLAKKGNVNKKILPWAIGKYSFASNDARQWAAWGMDYLKYDWNPIEPPETQEMYDALRASGRDIIFSLSNGTPFQNIPRLCRIANCWRTSGDIRDTWQSMSSKGFGEDKWASFAGPGHWNDPDMLVVGYVGWGSPHPSGLTPDEQYTHITLWCLDASPLLLGCDLRKLDPFTLNLLENDEVLAVNQDPLGEQAVSVSASGEHRVLARKLADGSRAVGLFNLSTNGVAKVRVTWSDLKIQGNHRVRDLWRQKDLGKFKDEFSLPVAAHGAELVKIQR